MTNVILIVASVIRIGAASAVPVLTRTSHRLDDPLVLELAGTATAATDIMLWRFLTAWRSIP